MELVVATKNKKKLREIKDLLKGSDIAVTSIEQYPHAPRIIENGKTFKANAITKALVIARYTKKLALGEDSGLCVDSLGGKPGIYSARFAGPGKSDEKNNAKLLRLLKNVPVGKRKAGYVCAVAVADARGLIGVVEGTCRGYIGFEPRGTTGFGYDPLFVSPKYKKTFAELGEAVKHTLSHRFRALLKAKKLIRKGVERQTARRYA